MGQQALRSPRYPLAVLALVVAAVPVLSLSVQAQISSRADLAEMKLEDLMNVQVTSVSKKEQKISHTASAIYVITQEDIRRSAATNIPDLLRMVPGLNVAQMNASTWAVSARGFNGEFSNKLLVLLDGRSVYLPTTSGVFWDVLDVPLEDIERIEVIRGPGGTTWGANAVNGVINIITKKASETHGGMVVAGAGTLEQGFGTVQGGASLGTRTDFRIFGKYSNHTDLPASPGGSAYDPWHVLREGFRADTTISSSDSVSVEGDVYSGRAEIPETALTSIADPRQRLIYRAFDMTGGYLQSEWKHRYSERSDTTLLVSFDRYSREDALAETRNTLNIDFQHHFAGGARQDVVWGGDYRETASSIPGSEGMSVNLSDQHTRLSGLFVQDEIGLVPNRLAVTVGTKLEHNYYTHFGVMPSARLTWQMDSRSMAWAAVSRAIRTPSALDASMQFDIGGFITPEGLPVIFRLQGNPRIENENLTAYEVGYRTQWRDRLTLDIAAYYNSYDHLLTTETTTPFMETSPPPLHTVQALLTENLMAAETQGAEVSANWKITDRWSLSPRYAFEQVHARLDRSSHDVPSLENVEGVTPAHWARIDSLVRISRDLLWNTDLTFVDRLTLGNVPSYNRLDTQLTWHFSEKAALTLAGQNLLRDHHLEIVDPATGWPSSLVKRSGSVKFTWWF